MNYGIWVLSFNIIKVSVFSVLFLSTYSPAILAADLTPQEQNICPSIRVCVDIIRRHDASEFDYDALEVQFRRFGPEGRNALFDVLESKAGNPDVARMISLIGPLNASERLRIKKNWSQERAAIYLPLLLDGHPLSRDLLLSSLAAEQPSVREAAKRALIRLPKSAQSQPLPNAVRAPLLDALSRDPIPEAAPYLARMNADGIEEELLGLLSSGEPSIVSAAYMSLHGADPSKAFQGLLAEMGRFTSPKQSQAIGQMLLRRHAQRDDGFYLKFARDISGDKTRAISARASGLHAVLSSGGKEVPEFTPERAQALAFLVRAQPRVTNETYLPFLKQAKGEREMALIWEIAQQEKWVNRDQISAFFKGEKLENKVVSDLLRSDDFRSFKAGILQAKPIHNHLVYAKIDHAIADIRNLARAKLKIPPQQLPARICRVSKFDFGDLLNQMPFFDAAWITVNGTRVALDRKFLTTAHPSIAGWLAGYDLPEKIPTATSSGSALVFYKFESGSFHPIGDFSSPMAILPDRALKLGQTTQRFWVIDRWLGETSDVSAYTLDISAERPKITHLGALPNSVAHFSVAPNGDLLMQFDDKKQAPIRLTRRGDMSPACSQPRRALDVSAPN